MTLIEMLQPNAVVEATPENIAVLLDAVKNQQHDNQMEALAFYVYTCALVIQAGGKVELTAEHMTRAEFAGLELADLEGGGHIVRVVEAKPLLIEHEPVLAKADPAAKIILPH